MCDIARVRFNDVVRLAYLTEEQADQIDALDLTALREFKRSSSGAVEIKLTDRVEVLEKVMQLMNEGELPRGEQFLQALVGQGQKGDEDK
jgi:hypothetical protein